MKPDDEPRIKRTRKPQIEERLPPHLDEERYEIIGQPASDNVYAAPEEKRTRERKPKKYLAPRVYFYICVVLLIVVAIEAVMLGIAQSTVNTQKETINSLDNNIKGLGAEIEDREGSIEQRENHITANEEKIASLEKENRKLKSQKDSADKHIEKIQNYPKTFEFLCRYFVFDLDHNDAEGTLYIQITYPDQTIFDFLLIDPEKVTISIELVERKNKWNNLLEESARVIGVTPGQVVSEQYTIKQKLEPGDYEVVVTISCEGETPVRIIIYRLKILESQ